MAMQQTDWRGTMAILKPQLLTVFLISLLVALPGICSAPQEGSLAVAHDPQTVREILTSFLASDFEFEPQDGTEDPVAFETEVLHSGYSRARGNWVSVRVGTRFMHLSLSQQRVEWMIDSSQTPTSFSSFEIQDGQKTPVDVKKRKRELVRFSRMEARKRASDFVESHLGLGALKSLIEMRGELVTRGGMFVYRFSWDEPKTEAIVKHGLERIRVDVNPTTGGISEFQHVLNRPDAARAIPHDLAQRLAEAECSEEGDLEGEVVSVRLLNRFDENGNTKPAWVVTFKVAEDSAKHLLSSSGPGFSTCEVDAISGQILSATAE